jgi:hypothetical protein
VMWRGGWRGARGSHVPAVPRSGARIFLVWGPAREQEAGEYGGGRTAAHPLKVPSSPLIIAPHACSASENQSEVKIWEAAV